MREKPLSIDQSKALNKERDKSSITLLNKIPNKDFQMMMMIIMMKKNSATTLNLNKKRHSIINIREKRQKQR